jgi:nickel/cobalt exporter
MTPALLQEGGRLQGLLQSAASDPAALATALAVAFVLGAAHALQPGHGKAVVAAYLAGSRGRLSDAFFLGGVVTLTHTASVFVLGLATLYASTQVHLDRVLPVMSLASGVLVAAIGGYLLWRRATARAPDHSHQPGRGGLTSLGVSGGMVPCPEALVVLMLAVSLGRVGLGLAILVAFTLGLAAVLIGIGSAMVLAAPAAGRLAGEPAWMKRLPVVSAALVTLLGVVMVVQALGS